MTRDRDRVALHASRSRITSRRNTAIASDAEQKAIYCVKALNEFAHGTHSAIHKQFTDRVTITCVPMVVFFSE